MHDNEYYVQIQLSRQSQGKGKLRTSLAFSHLTPFFPTTVLQVVPKQHSLFSFCLPRATLETAKMLAESMNERIAQLDVQIPDVP